MSMSDPDPWVSIRAVAWVIDEAPVPAELAFTLIVIARRCDEHGRGSYQSIRTIAAKTGKSEDQTTRDIKRLRELGLILLGDQSLPAEHGVPQGRRPVVYDLPLSLKGPKPTKPSKNRSGHKKQPSPGMDAPSAKNTSTRMDAPSSTRIHAGGPPCMDAQSASRMDAPQTIPNNPSNKTSVPPSESARHADDTRGRRWLATTFSLDTSTADEIIRIVRDRAPRIRHLVRYLEAMHRHTDGKPKPDLLDIIEAVQDTGPSPAADDDVVFPPGPRCFSSPTGCRHDAPDPERTRCVLCTARQGHTQTPQLAELLTRTRSALNVTRDRYRQRLPSSSPTPIANIPANEKTFSLSA